MKKSEEQQKKGIEAFKVGDYEEAKAYFEGALEAATAENDRKKMAEALNDLGVVYRELDDIDNALQVLEQALQHYQDMDDERGEAITLGNLGKAEESAGKIDDAVQSYLDSAAIFEELGETEMAMFCWQALSRLKLNQKDWLGAITAYEEGIAHLPDKSIKKKILQKVLKAPTRFLG
jgi:tetratricopeptide (TPR) repeat protein